MALFECVWLFLRGEERDIWERYMNVIWHDKDGSRTIRSAIAENPCCGQTLWPHVIIEPEILPIEVLHDMSF